MPIAPPLQRFVDDELARAETLIDAVVDATLLRLRDSTAHGLTAEERAMEADLTERLRRHAAVYRSTFVESLRTRVRAELARRDGGAGMAPPSGLGGLALMDESRVEIDIEISRATQSIDAAAEWELRELQTFTSTLIGQTHVSAESNPLRPTLYATALWDAGCIILPTQPQRAALLRAASGAAAALLKKTWAAASTRLESQGIVPGIYRTVVLAAGATTARPDAGRQDTALHSLLRAMPPGGDLRVSPGAAMEKGAAASATANALPADAEEALGRWDELLRQAPDDASSKADAATVAARLDAQRALLAGDARTTPRERQAVALVARVFDAMLADPDLQPAFGATVARLQVTVLRIAWRDPSLFDSLQHVAWSLLDRIGEASATYPQPADPRGAALLVMCQRVVGELNRHPDIDAERLRRVAARLDEFLAAQLQAQVKVADAAVQQLRAAEQFETMTANLAQRLVEQMAPLRPAPVVQRFMSGPWARVLATAILRHGEEDASTRGYIQLVDELLWSVQVPDHPASHQRLAALLPDLLQRLRAGMASIALPPAEQQAFLRELLAIHSVALPAADAVPPETLSSAQIVERLRDEPAADESEPLIDLGSLPTVPAELLPHGPEASMSDGPAQQVSALHAAARRRMFVNGRWSRVQLLWRSDEGRFFLFAGEAVGQTHSITRRALERLVAAGLLKPLEPKPLTQRAVDAVTRQIALVSGLGSSLGGAGSAALRG